MPKIEPWATLRVALRPGRIERDALASAADRLEHLGALLADDDTVGGVETRDPSTTGKGAGFVTVERPELIVYTVPNALPAIEIVARQLASQLELDVIIEGEIRDDDDWRERWKEFYTSHRFGETLLIRPSWTPREDGDPNRELILDPGRAFGTGLHASTRLCQEAIIALAEAGANPTSILDLGCGSGVLGLMCARLFPGAHGHLSLVDIDEEATTTTRENASLNGLDPAINTHCGTVDTLPPGLFSLVIANIRPEVLIPQAAAIGARVARGGLLLLSGILDEEAKAVADAYLALGLCARDDSEREGWVMLTMEPPP